MFVWYPEFEQNMLVYVDVTPENRYAVWNKRFQRFAPLGGPVGLFKSRALAEVWIRDCAADLGHNYTVVEFDDPDSE